MNVLLFGATGMVGMGVLIECLEDPAVESVLSIGRRPCGRTHPKLREVIRADLFDLEDLRGELVGLDACFFCLGVSSAGMREDEYRRITLDLTISVARLLSETSPDLTFCFVSGAGTDSTESGRVMWARVKGMAENRLRGMFVDVYMFRPGFIEPMKGVRSRTVLYRALYALARPVQPLIRRLFRRHMTTSVNVGLAMIEAARTGYPKRILENADIDALAERRVSEPDG